MTLMRTHAHITINEIVLLTLLTACSTEVLDTDVPIVFAPVTRDVTEATRAGGNGLEHDFVVCGYKMGPQGQQYVIPKYGVTYSNGTYNYATERQPQVYWDTNASEYRFWGYTGNNIESTGDGTTINIPVALQKELPASLPLFSELKLITQIDYKTVELEFLRPISRLAVIFFSGEPLSDGQEISIKDVAITPKENSQDGKVSKIWNTGTVTVSYPLNGGTRETVSVSQNNATPVSESLSFKDLTLTKDVGGKIDKAAFASVLDAESNYYYPLPMGDKNPEFVLTMNLDGEDRRVTIPEQYMHWQANHSYNYFFVISGVSKNVELYDVKIEPWHYGGSQDEEWHNWW